MMPDLEDRIIDLETRLTYQEAMLQELNDVIVDQRHAIDGLTKTVVALRERVQALHLANTASCSEETPPPHY